MDSLTTTETILGLIVATIGIQATVGTIVARVLWSHYTRAKELFVLQVGHLTTNLDRAEERAERAEDQLDDCRDDLQTCHDRINGGFRT